MSEVCRDFGISRKTGYKIFSRYKDQGLDALTDRSRRPVRYANQPPAQLERLIVDLKRDKPHAGDLPPAGQSTVHVVLDRHGLVKRARMRRNRANGTPLSAGVNPTSRASSSSAMAAIVTPDGLRPCCALSAAVRGLRIDPGSPVIEAFQRLFRDRGLPVAIRSDNGLPFASPNGLYNLSRLSVWWLRLGIAIERIMPGHPHVVGPEGLEPPSH
jgi:leucine-zipper of insertion element IS481